jgi:ACS family hexuronate transporter-like MFS transporter
MDVTRGPMRWAIAALLFAATTINYVDRQTLSVAAPYIRGDLPITNEGYGYAVGSFLAAYTIMHLVSGVIVDVAGTRIGFALAVGWWSIANMLHAAARDVWSLCAFRFLLGAGEAGGYPAAIKCVGEWFRPSERALVTGLFNTGAAFGAIVAAPLVAWLVLGAGWRAAFIFTGGAGLLWVFGWLLFYKRCPGSDGIRPLPGARMDLRRLIALRPIRGLALARFLSDPVWYFYLFWLPSYLKDVCHFSLAEVGYFAWIPFLTADLGSLAGGAASSWLIRRGYPLFRARHIAMLASALLMPAALFVARAEHPATAVAWISLATFGHQSWSSNSMTLPADLLSSENVASAYGLTGGAGSLGASLISFGLGHVITRLSYGPVFAVAGLLHPLAALIVILTVKKPVTD